MTYAIVKKADGSTYVSPLFAFNHEGWRSVAIGLDESLSHVQKLNVWHHNEETHITTRGLYIVFDEYADIQEGWAGADWVLNDKKLMKKLTEGKQIPLTEDPRFADYARPITLPTWFEVQTETDAASLETVSFDFHDATLEDFTEEGEDWTIRFDTSWECIITVKFCGVTEEAFKEKVGLILDSYIEKTADGCTFTVIDGYGGWIDGVEFDRDVENAYIKCKKIFWKIEIES